MGYIEGIASAFSNQRIRVKDVPSLYCVSLYDASD